MGIVPKNAKKIEKVSTNTLIQNKGGTEVKSFKIQKSGKLESLIDIEDLPINLIARNNL